MQDGLEQSQQPGFQSETMTAATEPSDQRPPRAASRHLGWGLIAIAAIAIGLYAVPPYATFDPLWSRIPLNAAFTAHMLWLSVHAVPSGLALIIGPFQFMPAIRTRWPKAHRLAGKVYLCCVVLGSIAAIASTIMTTAGFAAQVGFSLLIMGWLLSAWHAYRAARQRRFADHRIWMIRNYALTFAAVLLRVFLVAGMGVRQLVPSIPFDQLYTSSLWSAIFVSALVAEWFIVTRARPKAR
ncbi:DUF2306 domain-containing protein [Nitratireductor soli]|uniref:DUF2306 domain-containing protein n=1 Tax=Nitratireductor soli TaxID=1670619 RepID=UPI000B1B8A99|nr:DUF2306 domain-containing protein [Nitratireductor soli]